KNNKSTYVTLHSVEIAQQMAKETVADAVEAISIFGERAAVRAGAILGGASQEELDALTVYAEKFGLAFQITDDVLDVIGSAEAIGKPVGSDIKNNKSTYVTLHSVEIAQQMAKETVADAVEAISIFGERAAVLKDLVEYLLRRES
ncbi:MAG: polyprenyl synthetase family protein, partial [Selenomonadales bacterium]|nr:polyprenyl synthetase family protein [Selenomonadales bacterium]